MPSAALPAGWDEVSHDHWIRGEKQAAIDAVLSVINRSGPVKPVHCVLQLAYYVYLCGDAAAAAHFLERARPDFPRHPELLRNLAVCLSRSGQDAAAVERVDELLTLSPDDIVAHDTRANCLARLGRYGEASAAGTRALRLKDAARSPPPVHWRLPQGKPSRYLAGSRKRSLIAFSLWGAAPRYLRGAIDNAIAAASVYPDWTLCYFVDETVPLEVRDALRGLGAELRLEPPGQDLRRRLGWRFKVANDPGVARFLVRDVDSVVNERERRAVDEWIASERWFHVMRDWWTHTDLMLAGMWGGVAGILPPLSERLAAYSPGAMETPNIDQWFLRDEVWPCVRTSCLVHDRCFSPPGTRPWPETPPAGNAHVGQNVFAAERELQQQRLSAWLERLPSLRVPEDAAGAVPSGMRRHG